MIDTDRIWTWLTKERKGAIGVDDGWCGFDVLRIGDGLRLTTPIQKSLNQLFSKHTNIENA